MARVGPCLVELVGVHKRVSKFVMSEDNVHIELQPDAIEVSNDLGFAAWLCERTPKTSIGHFRKWF